MGRTAMSEIPKARIAVHVAWWARAFLAIATRLADAGVPVNPFWVAGIYRRGIRIDKSCA